MVDEVGTDSLAERGVVPRVQDERVPADVHQRRGREVAVRHLRAELQEAEGFIHNALREESLHVLVLDDPANEPIPNLVVDEVLVGQLRADRHLLDGDGHGHNRDPFSRMPRAFA